MKEDTATDLRRQLGQRIGKADIERLVASADDAMIGQLCHLLSDPDRRTSDNAAWLMTHLPATWKGWLLSCQPALIDKALHSSSEAQCRLLLTLIARQPLSIPNDDNNEAARSTDGNKAVRNTDSHNIAMRSDSIEDAMVNESNTIALLDFCLSRITHPDTSIGIRSVCIKIASKLCLPYPDLQGELLRTLQGIAEEHKTPAIRCAIKHLLADRNQAIE